jgi:hypothetical protein
MPNIKIDELQPAGVEFFEGAEGYLDNLSEDKNGGISIYVKK